MMIIREAAYSDTDRIYTLYRTYGAALSAVPGYGTVRGIPGYDDVFGDIEDGICYTVMDAETLAGVFVCELSEDTLCGSSSGCDWYEGEYAVVHRIAVNDPDCVRAVVGFVSERCRQSGIDTVRCAVCPFDNAVRTALEECGFENCGTLRTPSGEYSAYRYSLYC